MQAIGCVEFGEGDSDMALALQSRLHGGKIHHFEPKAHRTDLKLISANFRTSLGESQRMISFKDVRIHDLTMTNRANDKDLCIVAENPRHPKRTKVLLNIEDCNNLNKKDGRSEKN